MGMIANYQPTTDTPVFCQCKINFNKINKLNINIFKF